jgi:hypothetical protein
MKDKKFEALSQLLGCYFHQDWPQEFATEELAFSAILKAEPKDYLLRAAMEIDAILSAEMNDEDLKVFMVEVLGCYFDPTYSGECPAHWLIRVRALLMSNSAQI